MGGRRDVATTLPLYENDASFLTPLKKQVAGVADAIRALVAANATLYGDGYHLVCEVTGRGLICRWRGPFGLERETAAETAAARSRSSGGL